MWETRYKGHGIARHAFFVLAIDGGGRGGGGVGGQNS